MKTEPSTRVEDQALELRRKGQSFKSIAKELGMARSADANDAFQRSLRRQPKAARERLRQEELERLDAVAARLGASQKHDPDDVARRLQMVERLRAKLLAD